MANERAIDKKVIPINVEYRLALKVRHLFGKKGDSRSDYFIRALEEVVKDVKLTVAEEAEAAEYTKAEYAKRHEKRALKEKAKTSK